MSIDKPAKKPETPYEEGKLGFHEGKNFTHNPYAERTSDHRAWYCGWKDEEESRCAALAT